MNIQRFFMAILICGLVVGAEAMTLPQKDKEEASIAQSNNKNHWDNEISDSEFSDTEPNTSNNEFIVNAENVMEEVLDEQFFPNANTEPAVDHEQPQVRKVNNAPAREANNEPTIPAAVPVDKHLQARIFHARLTRLHPEWFDGDVQAYYKKIDPIISRPAPADKDLWDLNLISIAENNRIVPDANNRYTYNGFTLDLTPLSKIDSKDSICIPVTYNNERFDVQFIQISQKKIPVVTQLEDYNTCITDIQENKLSLINIILLKGILYKHGERPLVILIKAQRSQQEPIKLQGMEFVFNKTEGRTHIFFDFVDSEQKPVELIRPIIFNHAHTITDKKVFCIKEKQVYECKGKIIYNFFDSIATRRKWAPNEVDFYDLNNNQLVPLPSCYSSATDREETAKEPFAYIVNNNRTSFYQLQALEIQEVQSTTDYIYCDHGKFYALLPHKAICKEYLSQDPNNTIQLDYLLQVKELGFKIRRDVGIPGSHQDWPSGLYKRIRERDKIIWRQVLHSVNAKPIEIEFLNNNEALDITWPAELNYKRVMQWCDASQRLLILNKICSHICDREIVNRLRITNNLNYLDLSHIMMGDSEINWNHLSKAFGDMQQLTQFRFAYNHPIKNIIDIFDQERFPGVNNYYTNLANGIGRLRNLKQLCIKGLFLKNRTQLDSTCGNKIYVSPEIASLTYFIATEEQAIRTLIDRICQLPQLRQLNIDGIPNYGNSKWSRQSNASKLILSPLWVLAIPFSYNEASQQKETLRELVQYTSNRLAQIPSLQEISVYSPHGECETCDNYFSRAICEQLNVTRTEHPNFPPLTINAEALE